ncbi:YdgH/BhsA/McbA-like domain containing protein [Serratia marcescens]|uniref:YdgH/BhsA/McbA-like domain containing protein n=1 Tax=Serratia marcescens TaxID=615 RepID=UPI0013DC178E|nr:YdgH/BhsA/McbA-like domain containing protein [Serratia marcescens]
MGASKKTISLLLLTLLSSTVSATETPVIIDRSDLSGKEFIGNISINGVRGSFDDAIRALQGKAENLGGSQLNITALGTPGDSSLWSGNAKVYR